RGGPVDRLAGAGRGTGRPGGLGGAQEPGGQRLRRAGPGAATPARVTAAHRGQGAAVPACPTWRGDGGRRPCTEERERVRGRRRGGAAQGTHTSGGRGAKRAGRAATGGGRGADGPRVGAVGGR